MLARIKLFRRDYHGTSRSILLVVLALLFVECGNRDTIHQSGLEALRQILDQESKLASKSAVVSFSISFEDAAIYNEIQERFASEMKSASRIRFEWSGNKFIAEAENSHGGTVRRVISDGEIIETDVGDYWDIHSLEARYNHEWKKSEEFNLLIWPYHVAVQLLFPQTLRGELDLTSYKDLYEIDHIFDQHSQSAGVIELQPRPELTIEEVGSIFVEYDLSRKPIVSRTVSKDTSGNMVWEHRYGTAIDYIEDSCCIPKTYDGALVTGLPFETVHITVESASIRNERGYAADHFSTSFVEGQHGVRRSTRW